MNRVLESVGFGVRHNIEVMRKEGATPKHILAVGGGTSNPIWLQIVSDIADIEQHVIQQRLGASYGDAFLAGVGVGLFAGTAEAARWARVERVVRPQPEVRGLYDERYRIFRKLYTDTAPLMNQLGVQSDKKKYN